MHLYRFVHSHLPLSHIFVTYQYLILQLQYMRYNQQQLHMYFQVWHSHHRYFVRSLHFYDNETCLQVMQHQSILHIAQQLHMFHLRWIHIHHHYLVHKKCHRLLLYNVLLHQLLFHLCHMLLHMYQQTYMFPLDLLIRRFQISSLSSL